MQSAKNHLIDFLIATNPKYEPSWFHERIANELERIERLGDQEYKVLLVFVPPRHGKSELCSIGFPAWYLGRNPTKEIITVSYSAELAQDFGSKTRSIVSGEAYPYIFSGITLKEDEQAKAKWRTNKGGSYTSVGVGGAITGRGANCFPAGTLITTEVGQLPIEDCKHGTRVLSYNHVSHLPEWKSITGTLRRSKKGFTTITTVGKRSVKSTNEHPFFIFGKGYAEAQTLKQGERLGVLQDDEMGNPQLHCVPQTLYKDLGRVHKKGPNWSKGLLLFGSMLRRPPLIQKQQTLSLWQDCFAWAQILLKRLYSFSKKIKGEVLRFLWQRLSASFPREYVLLYGLQERLSFAGYASYSKSELQAWNGNGRIPARVLQDEAKDTGKGWGQVRNLFEQKDASHPPSRLQPSEQQRRQFGNYLQAAPRHSSQIGEDTISSIASSEEELDVYDIEVEDNHNFFANGILVHNCLLFDDPIKNREEAESEVYREKVWQFFTSTAFTRLEPKGVVVVILTRWHVDDLAGRILKNPELSKRCKIIHFPAINKDGEALWTEHFDVKALTEIKNTIGPYDWNALYQGSPIVTERQELKTEWIRRRTETEVAALNCRRFLTIDTAISKAASSDFTGFCDNRINRENYWHLKAWRMRLGPEELVQTLFALWVRAQNEHQPYEKIGIEKTIYLDALKPYLDEEQRKRDIFLPIMELRHNQTQKEVRIRGLIPRYATGSVFHIQGECNALEEEMLQFPQGLHDDTLDATAYQLQITSDEATGQVAVHIPVGQYD